MSSFDVSDEYAWFLNGLARVDDKDPFACMGEKERGDKVLGTVTERIRRETALYHRLDHEFKAMPRTDPQRAALNERKVIVERFRRISFMELSARLETPIDMSNVRKGGTVVAASRKLRLSEFSGK